MDDILDEYSREIRRLEAVITRLKDCLIASGVPENIVAIIATDAYNRKEI